MSSAEVTTASAIAALEKCAQETCVDIAASIDLDSLDGQHQGVLLHKEEFDPNQCDREEVIEVLWQVLDVIDEDRVAALEEGSPFTSGEAQAFEQHVRDDRADNILDGSSTTIWFSKWADDTGSIVVVTSKGEDGEHEFEFFTKSEEAALAQYENNGYEFVG